MAQIGETKWEKGQGWWPQIQFGAFLGSNECDGVEKSGCSPHTTIWSVRGAKTVPPGKGIILSSLPILEDPSKGGWEALNRTAMLTAIAGNGEEMWVVYKIVNLPPLPHPSPEPGRES